MNAGKATYRDFRLYEEDRMPINIEVYGQAVSIPNIQVSMTNSGNNNYVQDSIDHVMSVSADGKKVTAFGNSWKRFKLDEVFSVSKSTMLRFTAHVEEEAEAFIVCLMRDTHNAYDGRHDCFAISGKEVSSSNNSWKVVSPQLVDGETHTYEINVGSYFTGDVYYLGLGQDNDKAFTATRAEGEAYVDFATLAASSFVITH